MKKIAVVVTNRASWARVQTVIEAFYGSTLYHDLILSVDAQNDLQLPEVDHLIHTAIQGSTHESMAKSLAIPLIELSTIFANGNYDAVITVADRYETLATAIAASYQNIPLIHIQGGEISGSIDDKVRNAVSQLADIHFPATEKAADRIFRTVLRYKHVHATGCPSIDLAARWCKEPFEPPPDTLGSGYEYLEWDKPFYLVSLHPDTTAPAALMPDVILSAIDKTYINQIVWIKPNIDAGSDIISKRLRQIREGEEGLYKILFYDHVSARHYIHLMQRTECLIGNSSSGIREGSFLGTPVINLGDRQKGRERASNVVDLPFNPKEISKDLKRNYVHKSSELYGDGTAGIQIVKHIEDIL